MAKLPFRSKEKLFRITLLFCTISILVLSTIRVSAPANTINNDKLGHALAFFCLYGLLDFAWQKKAILAWQKYLSLFAYGILIECIQYFLPWRDFSLADMLANGLGLLAYLAAAPVLFMITDRPLNMMKDI